MRCLVTALLRSDEHYCDKFEITTAVSTSAQRQDQSGDPAPYSEEAHLAQFSRCLLAKNMPVNHAN